MRGREFPVPRSRVNPRRTVVLRSCLLLVFFLSLFFDAIELMCPVTFQRAGPLVQRPDDGLGIGRSRIAGHKDIIFLYRNMSRAELNAGRRRSRARTAGKTPNKPNSGN